MVYEKDTLIAGENCMKIVRTRQRFTTGIDGMPISLPPDYYISYYSQHSDTLYKVDPGNRTVLFVFNLNIGDSWEVLPPMQQGADTACVLPNKTYVLDTGTVIINGKSLRYWDVGLNDSSFIYMQGRFIEQIGYMSSFLLNYNTNNCAGGIIECCTTFFTCFESDSIGFYNTSAWPYNQCEYYYSLGETANPGLRVFPNPVTEVLYIDPGPGVFDVDILDMQGRVQKTLRQQTPGAGISFREFPPGIYMACIKRPGHPAVWHKLVKN